MNIQPVEVESYGERETNRRVSHPEHYGAQEMADVGGRPARLAS